LSAHLKVGTSLWATHYGRETPATHCGRETPKAAALCPARHGLLHRAQVRSGAHRHMNQIHPTQHQPLMHQSRRRISREVTGQREHHTLRQGGRACRVPPPRFTQPPPSAQHTGPQPLFSTEGSTSHKGDVLGRQAHPCMATRYVRQAAKPGRQRDLVSLQRQRGLMPGRPPGRSGTSARWPARAPPS